MPRINGRTAIITVPVEAVTPVCPETHQWYAPQIVPKKKASHPESRSKDTAVKSRTK